MDDKRNKLHMNADFEKTESLLIISPKLQTLFAWPCFICWLAKISVQSEPSESEQNAVRSPWTWFLRMTIVSTRLLHFVGLKNFHLYNISSGQSRMLILMEACTAKSHLNLFKWVVLINANSLLVNINVSSISIDYREFRIGQPVLF